MDRLDLEESDRAAMIEIILPQQEIIERLVAEVAVLKARLGRRRRCRGTRRCRQRWASSRIGRGVGHGIDVVAAMGLVLQ